MDVSVVGFERSVIHLVLKIMLPIPFAAILVFSDTTTVTITSVLSLLFFYHLLQLYYVRASSKKIPSLIYLMVAYIVVILYISENPIERNIIGWAYITLMSAFVAVLGVQVLVKSLRLLKLTYISKPIKTSNTLI